jgi:methylmalonyl-CoA mutase cobalamin-binding domain/chain
MDDDFDILKRALIAADLDAGVGAAGRLIDAGTDPRRVLEDGMAVAMFDLGERWRRGEVFLPEVVASATLFKKCNEIVEPALLAKGGAQKGDLVVTATVKGDLHDLGKGLVGIMLKGVGYDVIDLGKDVPPERFVETAVKEDAKIIGMSALLTTTMPAMKTVVDLLTQQDLRGRIRTIIGGAPVTRAYAEEIGADAYAFDAANSVECVKALLGQ